MAEEKIKLPIRSALIPVFYQNFRCLAQECRDSCCAADWSIPFDKKDYLRLRRLNAPAELREKLEPNVRRYRKTAQSDFYGKFQLDNGRCPLLNGEGLCSLQLACGEDVLPAVCRTYPRKTAYSSAAKEYSLSPSCEGVLQQLWDLPEGVEFVAAPLPKAEWKDAVVTPGENLIASFAPIRSLCIDILQNRSMPLTERMLYLGVTLQLLQKEDWRSLDADVWAARMNMLSGAEAVQNISGNRDMYLLHNLNVLKAVSTKRKDWVDGFYEALEVRQRVTLASGEDGFFDQKNARFTTQYSYKAYEEALEQFNAAFGERAYFFENLMVAAALYLDFPNLDSREELWKSYVSLCSLYSFYYFVSVAGCKRSAAKEDLFHNIVVASRITLHNRSRLNRFRDELFQHDSTTLAHMAILLGG